MTNEKAVKDMKELIEKNGFKYEGEQRYDGTQIFTRRWTKKVDVVWYGEMDSTLEIKISMSYGVPLVKVYKNGRFEGRCRDYSSPKRAFNAIGEIVRCAGFEM